MAKRIIECQVNDEYVVGAGVPIGASGSHDDVILRLKFNDMWAGLYIYATFRDALGGHPTVVLLLPTMLVDGKARTYDVTIPAAAKLYNGKATVTLTGYLTKQEQTEDGIKRTVEDSATNTATAYFTVLPSNYAFAEDGSITPTIAQQLQDAMGSLYKDVDNRLSNMETAIGDHVDSVDAALGAQDIEINHAEKTAESAKEIAQSVRDDANNGLFKGEKGDPGEKGGKGDPGSIKFTIVTELPEEDIDESAIYLVPSENPSEDNKFIEYFYANGRWEMLPGGGINVDLTDYATKKFVEDGFVAKGTSPGDHQNGIYGITPDNTQKIFPAYAPQGAGKVAITDPYGCLYVADPRQPNNAASKQYVDKLFNSIVNGEEVAY